MKKVILLTAFLTLLLSFLTQYLSFWAYVLLFFLFAVFSAVLLLSKNQKLLNFFFAFLLIALFCLKTLNCFSAIERAKTADGKNVDFEAIVVQSSAFYEFKDNKYAILQVVSDNEVFKKGEKVGYNYYTNELLKTGQKISGGFKVSSLHDSTNKYSFYSEGIYCFARPVSEVYITQGNNFHYNLLCKIQNFVNKNLQNNTKNSAVLISMIYGEKGYISPEFNEAVKMCGVSHVLVVSGLHFSLIFLVVSFLCGLIGLKGVKKDIALLIMAVFYMGLCGFSVSVIRVSLVFFIAFVSRRLRRIHTGIDSLIVALIIVLLINPFSIFSISFQLSFEATFGLLALFPEIKKNIDIRFKNRKIIKGLLNTAAVSLSAFVFTLPTVIYYFSYIATYTVVVNLLIGFAIPFMLGGSVIALLLCALGSTVLSGVAFFISDFFAEYFRGVVLKFSKLPFCVLVIKNNEIFIVLLLVSYLVVYELYTCKIRRSLVKYFKKEERK